VRYQSPAIPRKLISDISPPPLLLDWPLLPLDCWPLPLLAFPFARSDEEPDALPADSCPALPCPLVACPVLPWSALPLWPDWPLLCTLGSGVPLLGLVEGVGWLACPPVCPVDVLAPLCANATAEARNRMAVRIVDFFIVQLPFMGFQMAGLDAGIFERFEKYEGC
jgi:hypothetical protein